MSTRATVDVLGTRSNARLFWPLVVAFIARMLMMPLAHIGDPSLWEYGDIARNIIAGHGYSIDWPTFAGKMVLIPSAFMPPGETMIQLFSLSVFGDHVAGFVSIFLIQTLSGIGFVFFSTRLIELFFEDRRITIIAAWSAALFPSFVYTAATWGVASEVLMLNALFLYLACRFWLSIERRERVMLHALAFGVIAGVLALFRSEAPLTILCTLLFILYRSRYLFKRSFVPLIVAGSFAIAVITPWTIRNYDRFHTFVPGSTSGGINLWKGNNPVATGSGWNANGEVIAPTDTLMFQATDHGAFDPLYEVHLSSLLTAEAEAWMMAHPAEVVVLDLKKAAMLWFFDWYNPSSRSPAYIALSIVTLVVALFGVSNYFGDKRLRQTGAASFGIGLIVLIVTINTATSMIFFVAPRYQIFMVGTFWPFVVLGLNRLLPHNREAGVEPVAIRVAQRVEDAV